MSIARRRWALLAVLATGVVYAVPISGLGWNQGSHYALVEALDRGGARIDAFRWQTGDVSWVDDHFYSNKAPGLAFVALPVYAGLEAAGVTDFVADHSETQWIAARTTIWGLHLWAVVVPAVILLLLVRSVAERLEPGLGTVTAMTLGLGTLMLPFATVLFSHVLSSCLAFAAFVLLLRVRRDGGRPALVIAAGLLAGYAVAVEYPLGIVGLALGVYAVAGSGAAALRRGAAYAAGAALGVLPLLLYNRLAFGSFGHLSYVNAVSRPGRTGHDVLAANTSGFFGIDMPSPRVAAELLLSSRGLLTLSPVLAMSVVGLVLAYRRGWRAEALTIGAIAIAFLVFDAGYYAPFGGASPGPRLVIPVLPFLAVPIACAYRRYPLCTIGFAAASVVVLATVTATLPLLPDDDTGEWVSRLSRGDFQETVARFAGVHTGWGAAVPFLLPLAAAVVFTVLDTSREAIGAHDRRLALVALGSWTLVATAVPRLGHAPGSGAALLVVVAAGTGVVAVVAASLALRRQLPPATAEGPISPQVA